MNARRNGLLLGVGVAIGIVLGIAIGVALAGRLAHDDAAASSGDAKPADATNGGAAAGGAPAAASAPGAVRLDAQARSLAGIESVVPARQQVAPEQLATGRVGDVGELLAALRELAAARTARAAQAAVLGAVSERRARLRALAAQGEITIARELAELELAARREEAAAQAREAELDALQSRLRARWGSALAALAAADDRALAPLAQPGAQLIEFVGGATAPATVAVSADDDRAHARVATVLGPAAAALGGAARSSWYAWVAAADLRVGMQLSVWLGDAGAVMEGALLPSSALVWSDGAQWYYVEPTPGVFERRQVGAAAVTRPDGVLLPDGPDAGVAVVVRGAQALLAEESRRQIPREDDDD